MDRRHRWRLWERRAVLGGMVPPTDRCARRPGVGATDGGCCSAEPCSAEWARRRTAALAGHGSAIPMTGSRRSLLTGPLRRPVHAAAMFEFTDESWSVLPRDFYRRHPAAVAPELL